MGALSDASVPALVEEALASAKELASEEMSLALAEADHEVAALRRAFVYWFAGVCVAGAAVSWAGMALVMALGLGALGAGLFSVGGLALAGLALWRGRRELPDQPLARTRRRIERRVSHVKEALT